MGLRRTHLTIRGFKSIRELDIQLGPLTVLIGANGAGKSNFIEFFRMLKWMMDASWGLQAYVAKHGPASRLLFDGPKRTERIEARLEYRQDHLNYLHYDFTLAQGSGDRLFVQQETFAEFKNARGKPVTVNAESASESCLRDRDKAGDLLAHVVRNHLLDAAILHLRDTSDNARIRQKQSVESEKWRLWEDAGNLAPFLYRLHQEHDPAMSLTKAEFLTRLVLPFFSEYKFIAENGHILLRWREKGADEDFHAGQAADGALRAMALIALLAQPADSLPSIILLDEPELGLHPYALQIVAGLIKEVSLHTQVVVATQSATLLDSFDPQDVVVVSREGRESKFERKHADDLREWLEDYALGELWRKNVLGGGPMA